MFDENSNATRTTPSASSLAATPNANLLSQVFNLKDSRWLQVEVCREYLRGQCYRSDQSCIFAHPPPYVDIQQGRVTACFDSMKGKCAREFPRCKYLHPPQHIKEQLRIKGKNNLTLKNAIVAQLEQICTPMANPMIALQQQEAAVVNWIPTTPIYPQYYNGMIFPQVLQDPYASAAVNQQLQTAALLGSTGGLFWDQSAGVFVAYSSVAADDAAAQQHPTPSPLIGLQRKRVLEEDNGNDRTALGVVPIKRQTVQGYVPDVSFNSQLPPPRY